jgi:preflagellin peptidase FlaK
LISIMAAGLREEDIELLNKLYSTGKIPETFRVKKGVPFAPSILIGLLVSLFIGDLAIIFLNVLNWLLY